MRINWRRILKYWLISGVCSWICIISFCWYFLGTTAGAGQALSLTQRLLPDSVKVSAKIEDGNLGSGLKLKDLEVKVQQFLTIKADALDLSYDLWSVFKGRFDLNHLKADALHITLKDAEEKPEEPAAPEQIAAETKPWRLNLPLLIQIPKTELNDFAYISDIVEVKVKHFKGSLEGHKDNAGIRQARADGVLVELKPDPEPEAAAAKPQVKREFTLSSLLEQLRLKVAAAGTVSKERMIFNQAEALPAVELPLNTFIDRLELTDARYFQPQYDTGLVHDLKLSAAWHGTLLEVKEIQGTHDLGSVSLHGQMDFKQYYSMDFKFKAQGSRTLNPSSIWSKLAYQTKGQGELSGNLADLKLQLAGEKPQLKLNARMNTLDAGLPFTLSLKLSDLTLPGFKEEELKNFRLSHTELNLSGLLSSVIQAQGQGVLQGFELDPTKLNFILTSDLGNYVQIEKLTVKGAARQQPFELTSKGLIGFNQAYLFDGRLKSGFTDASFIDDRLAGAAQLEAKGTLALNFNLDNVLLDLDKTEGFIHWLRVKTKLEAQELTGALASGFKFKRLTVSQPGNLIDAKGLFKLKGHNDVSARLDLSRLDQLYPGLNGQLKADLKAKGDLSALQLNTALNAPFVSFNGMSLSGLNAGGVFDQKAQRVELKLKADSLEPDPKLKFIGCTLQLQGKFARHGLNFACGGNPQLKLTLSGAYVRHAYQGKLTQFILGSAQYGYLKLLQTAAFNYDLAASRGQLGALRLDAGGNQINLDQMKLNPAGWTIQAHTSQFQLQRLNQILPRRFRMRGNLDAQLTAGQRHGKFDLQARAHTGKSFILAHGVPLRFDNLSLNLEADSKFKAKIQANLHQQRGSLNLITEVSDPYRAKRLSGNILLKDFDLSLLTNLGTAFNDLQGRASVQGDLSGSLKQPLFTGLIKVKGKAEPSLDIGQVNDFDIKAEALGDHGRLNGKFNVNGGTLLASGNLNWREGARGDLNLQAKRLPLFLMGYGSAITDLMLNARLDDQAVYAGGYVNIPQARLKITDFSSGAQSPSRDEIIVPDGGLTALEHKVEPPLPMALDLNITLGNDVTAEALGMNTRLGGSLNLNKGLSDAEIKAQGKLEILDDQVELYGHRFILNQAAANFRGSIQDPLLEVEAYADPETLDEDVQAGMRVRGPVSDPRVTFFSRPAMSQNEIISYMLYGHGLDNTTQQNPGSNDAMLLGLGLASTAGLVNTMVGALGVQNVQLGTSGSGNDTQLSVQGNLSRRIRVFYGYGVFTSVSEFKLRYAFMRKLYAEFVSSVDQAVDLIYSFHFN